MLTLLLLAGCAPTALPCPPAATPKRVFITDNQYTGIQVRYAQEICESSAQSARLGGRWVPWLSYLSSHNPNAIDIVSDASPWYDLDGKVIFGSKDELASGPANPLLTTNWKRKLTSDDVIWTGTAAGGTASQNQCVDPWGGADWATTAYEVLGDTTTAGARGESWTYSGAQSCDKSAHLICLEQ